MAISALLGMYFLCIFSQLLPERNSSLLPIGNLQVTQGLFLRPGHTPAFLGTQAFCPAARGSLGVPGPGPPVEKGELLFDGWARLLI